MSSSKEILRCCEDYRPHKIQGMFKFSPSAERLLNLFRCFLLARMNFRSNFELNNIISSWHVPPSLPNFKIKKNIQNFIQKIHTIPSFYGTSPHPT